MNSEIENLDLSQVHSENVPIIKKLLTSTEVMDSRDRFLDQYCKSDENLKEMALRTTRKLIPKVLDQLITQYKRKGIHSVLGMSHVALLVATNIVTMTFTSYSIISRTSIGRFIMFMAAYLYPIFEKLISWLTSASSYVGEKAIQTWGAVTQMVTDDTVLMYAKLFGVVFATIIGVYFFNRMISSSSKYSESKFVKTVQNIMRANLKYNWSPYLDINKQDSPLMRLMKVYSSTYSVPDHIMQNLQGASISTDPLKNQSHSVHLQAIDDILKGKLTCVTLHFLLVAEHILNLYPAGRTFIDTTPFDDTTYVPPNSKEPHVFFPAVTEFLKWLASQMTEDQRKSIIDAYEAQKRVYMTSQAPHAADAIKKHWATYIQHLYTMHQLQATSPNLF